MNSSRWPNESNRAKRFSVAATLTYIEIERVEFLSFTCLLPSFKASCRYFRYINIALFRSGSLFKPNCFFLLVFRLRNPKPWLVSSFRRRIEVATCFKFPPKGWRSERVLINKQRSRTLITVRQLTFPCTCGDCKTTLFSFNLNHTLVTSFSCLRRWSVCSNTKWVSELIFRL